MKITSVQLGLGIVTVSLLILIYLIILIKQRVLLINPEMQLDSGGKKFQYQNGKAIKHDDFRFVKTKNRKYHVPKFMLDLYESNRVTGCNNSRPDVVRSVVPKHAGPILNNEILQDVSTNHLLIFDLPTHSKDEEFVSAELKILTLVEINANALVGVERLLKVSVYDDASRKLLFHQEMLIRHVNNTWLSFNITDPVIDILKDNSAQKKYLKIIITIAKSLEYFQDINNDLKLSLLPISENFEHDYPVLLLSYSSSSSPSSNNGSDNNNSGRVIEVTRRQKRGIEEDYEDELNKLWDDDVERKTYLKKLKRLKNACRRKPLYVDFAEIEYDEWIVQPSGYEAYQCQGRCFYPVAEHLDPTKHAIIQALLHNLAPSKVSRSCCVPTRLNSISILYVDENGVLTYRYAYRDMVVLECGCR